MGQYESTRKVRYFSNKDLKSIIRKRINNELLAADNASEDKISIHVFTTTKSNSSPAYETNVGHKFVTVFIKDKFISVTFLSKEQTQYYTIEHFLGRITQAFKSEYKTKILQNLEENF